MLGLINQLVCMEMRSPDTQFRAASTDVLNTHTHTLTPSLSMHLAVTLFFHTCIQEAGQVELINESSDKQSPVFPWSMCKNDFLCSYSPQEWTPITHLAHTPKGEGGGNHLFIFISKPKSNKLIKEMLLRWGWQPCEISPCEIGAHVASVVPVKNPITGWYRNNQSTSSLSRHAFFLLTPSHYSLIHLSELFQEAAFYLSLPPLPRLISVDILITGLI